ncbi:MULTISPECIES: DUF4097 family beta strand repeat-containing protein [unclassified Paenibacillus]|uniref:DUF4097 family beta strand repeat-containing protein n=1 Tax=unclassified Paenibacillus TaxID=185978 RepID=UPI001AE8D98C|nr:MULTISPECIES: DUF4097 family beta strand repeat-containing protein [unclassified Paenibacillus]MBP1157110.1 DUF4097 and DUF4098 domain-containing protein YvlB [Paenibacillus sp. PvP091]MBP1172151.1 DUF4097 and DUF4098 domain-containing protein YvlB [Paenibacillus sp. PvR098]MBP2438532.1 DUF4097 and DUF4098 domain-containing protein YvlB [Paenibacillus sp. PvP052]
MHKAGRYTAALLLVLVGGAVIADRMMSTSYTVALIEWWPLLFIFLGVEYISLNMKYRNSERQLKLDLVGVIFAVMISAVVIVSTQTTNFMKKFEEFNISEAIDSMTSEGRRFDKEKTAIPLSASTENIRIINPSGNVVLRPGQVDQVQVELSVIVKAENENEAKTIADESRLEFSESGNTLELQAVAKEYSGSYFGSRKPRVDLVVTLPEKQEVNLEMRLGNGKISASRLPIKERLTGETTNGEIRISELKGELRFKTSNGLISASQTAGSLTLETSNGRIELTNHEGDAVMESTNGEIRAMNTSGTIQAETSNGAIVIDGSLRGLKAHTSNGSVDISSRTVDGDWDVETSHGKIDLKLPSGGDYRIEGEGNEGVIETNLPLSIQKDTISGTIGAGTHRIRLETNGSLSIQMMN